MTPGNPMNKFFWLGCSRKKPLRAPFVLLLISQHGPGLAERASV
jgi:hypothetical protein